ncbi:unnamed protein product [Closterium sp. Yama58-4]|nr:unnamed protein product [Closterium sp. Yama58-4]
MAAKRPAYDGVGRSAAAATALPFLLLLILPAATANARPTNSALLAATGPAARRVENLAARRALQDYSDYQPWVEPPEECHEEQGNLNCPSGGGCMHESQVCDGKPHCSDGSDESPEFCRDFDCELVRKRWGHQVTFESTVQRCSALESPGFPPPVSLFACSALESPGFPPPVSLFACSALESPGFPPPVSLFACSALESPGFPPPVSLFAWSALESPGFPPPVSLFACSALESPGFPPPVSLFACSALGSPSGLPNAHWPHAHMIAEAPAGEIRVFQSQAQSRKRNSFPLPFPSSPQVSCPTLTGCMPPAGECNGVADCADGHQVSCSHVHQQYAFFLAPFPLPLHHWQVSCPTLTGCMPPGSECNGVADCADGSDEGRQCRQGYQDDTNYCGDQGLEQCPSDRYACLQQQDFCDGYRTCYDGYDEANCESFVCAFGMIQCPKTFYCASGTLCDGVQDCVATAEAEDEDKAFCRGYSCPEGFKKCADGLQCVAEGLFCDGTVNCNDGSDEGAGTCAVTPPAGDGTGAVTTTPPPPPETGSGSSGSGTTTPPPAPPTPTATPGGSSGSGSSGGSSGGAVVVLSPEEVARQQKEATARRAAAAAAKKQAAAAKHAAVEARRAKQEAKAAAIAEKKKKQEEKAAAIAEKKRKQEEKAAAIAEKKRKQEEKAAAIAEKKRKQEAKAAAIAEKKKKQEEKAAAIEAKKKKQAEKAAAIEARKEREAARAAAATK